MNASHPKTNLQAPDREKVESAQRVIRAMLGPSPLLTVREAGHLKLENLQPTGSFKVRGALNAIQAADVAAGRGVYTASAGNMARALAWTAAQVRCPVTTYLPEGAPLVKVDAVRDLGAVVTFVSYSQWWEILTGRGLSDRTHGRFVHPFADSAVMAGNATLVSELIDEGIDFDTVLVAVGGGGLAAGIAAGLHAADHPAQVVGVELDTSAALTAALNTGRPTTIEPVRGYVDGAGSPAISEQMWPLLRDAVRTTTVATLEQVGAAIRWLLRETKVLAEGAGALPIAALLSGQFDPARTVAIVSGGNIDPAILHSILETS